VDWRATNHLAAAVRHRNVASRLRSLSYHEIEPDLHDWVITCLFYSAVHYVAAYYFEMLNRSPMTHVERRMLMEQTVDFAPIIDAYNQLSVWSRTARYEATPQLDRIVQSAFDNLYDIAATIEGLLRGR
jgi:uncharacterized protein (DUF2236 family)